jgi:hypothetical protein
MGVKTSPGVAPDSSEGGAPEAEVVRFARAGAAAFMRDPRFRTLIWSRDRWPYLLMAHHLDASVHRIALCALTDDDLFLKAAGRMQDSSAMGRMFRTVRAVVTGRMP